MAKMRGSEQGLRTSKFLVDFNSDITHNAFPKILLMCTSFDDLSKLFSWDLIACCLFLHLIGQEAMEVRWNVSIGIQRNLCLLREVVIINNPSNCGILERPIPLELCEYGTARFVLWFYTNFFFRYLHKGPVTDLKWNPINSNYLLSSSRDSLVKLFDLRTMKDFQTCRGHKREVMSKFILIKL